MGLGDLLTNLRQRPLCYVRKKKKNRHVYRLPW